jgi:hypothetical protein
MISILASVVKNLLILALHENFITSLIFPLSFLDKIVELINIIFMVLSMVKFEGFFGNYSFKSIFWEMKFGEFENFKFSSEKLYSVPKVFLFKDEI